MKDDDDGRRIRRRVVMMTCDEKRFAREGTKALRTFGKSRYVYDLHHVYEAFPFHVRRP